MFEALEGNISLCYMTVLDYSLWQLLFTTRSLISRFYACKHQIQTQQNPAHVSFSMDVLMPGYGGALSTP